MLSIVTNEITPLENIFDSSADYCQTESNQCMPSTSSNQNSFDQNQILANSSQVLDIPNDPSLDNASLSQVPVISNEPAPASTNGGMVNTMRRKRNSNEETRRLVAEFSALKTKKTKLAIKQIKIKNKLLKEQLKYFKGLNAENDDDIMQKMMMI